MAITDEQLLIAEIVSWRILDKAKEMMHLTIIAKDGSVNNIILTPEQKQGLIARYLQGKTELMELYNQLP